MTTADTPKKSPQVEADQAPAPSPDAEPKPSDAEEIGGPKGPEPTRFGDWERGGRCSDF